MINATEKRRIFRGLLAGETCLSPASVSDPLSMRAAEALGFEIAMLAGSVASLAVLGAPDIALLTATEFAEQIRRLCRAGDLPLLVDGDHGYGNALNVRRTVEDVEAAGAAAITIEDTVLPARFAVSAAQAIAVDELAGKIRAALHARTDSDFVIVGRTSAAMAQSRADLLKRQGALQDAGADAVFITGLKTLQDLDALTAAARVPLILGAEPPGVTLAQLAERKVRMCLMGHQAYFDGVAATYRRLHQQRSRSTSDTAPDRLAVANTARAPTPADVDPKTLVSGLSRVDDYALWASQFLT